MIRWALRALGFGLLVLAAFVGIVSLAAVTYTPDITGVPQPGSTPTGRAPVPPLLPGGGAGGQVWPVAR